jgi:CubicO group peptidase (beta-lactamase class C family)
MYTKKRYRLNLTITAVICLFFVVPGSSQTPRPTDDQVRQLVAAQHFPGAAVAVVQDGKVLNEVVVGFANLQLQVPVSRDTRFQLASVTKIFTGTALLSLEQDGKLHLQDPLSKYLSNVPKPWGEVTLQELADHTSGLPDIIADPNKPLSPEVLNRSQEAALAFASAQPVLSAPGDKFRYDQTNYLLLKLVIEKVTRTAFRAFVTQRILQPSLATTSWGDARTIIEGRSDMYTALHGEALENGANLFEYPSYLDAAAGLNSTIADMEQFAALLTSAKMLTATSLERMWQPATNRRGAVIDIAKEFEISGTVSPAAGWFYADNSGGNFPRVFMTGGSATSILVLPKQKLCVVVLTNVQAKDDPLPIAETIAKLYFPELRPMF